MSEAEIDEGLQRWWSVSQLMDEISEDEVGMLSATAMNSRAYVIWKLYVDRPQRSRGIGHELLLRLDHMLRKSTVELWLEHYAFNTGAAAFYEREGFSFVREEQSRLAGVDRTIVWRMKKTAADGTAPDAAQGS